MQDVDKYISSFKELRVSRREANRKGNTSQALQSITRKNKKLKNPYDSSMKSEKNNLLRRQC